MAKKKKKKKLKQKNIIIFFLILIAIACLLYYILTMPIHNIYITDNKIVTDEEIINLAGLEEYPSFLLTKKLDMKKKIEQNKYIEKASIQKKLGNIISIKIKEYKPIAITKTNELILANGKKIDNTYDLSDIPILINNIENDKVYKNFAQKLSTIDPNILRQISEIEYTPVEVDEERFCAYMNDGNLVYITLTKINKLNKYNLIKDKLEGKVGTIYLDAGNYMEVKK